MRFLVCDDEQSVIDFLEKEIKKFDTKADVTCVNTQHELIKLGVDGKNNFDLIFLDIMLNDRNSVEIGDAIASYFPNAKIIYMTGFYDKASEILLKLKPFGYISKPIRSRDVQSYLKKFSAPDENNRIFFNINRIDRAVNADNIVYIESKRNVSVINTVDDALNSYERISQIEKRLPNFFCRCHQSYIINLKFVKAAGNDFFELLDGKVIAVSRSRKKAAVDKFYKYKAKIL